MNPSTTPDESIEPKPPRPRRNRHKLKQRRDRPQPLGGGKTPAQFRATWGICPSRWYRLKARGLAPAVVQPAGPGGRCLITAEDESAWVRARTKEPTEAE